MKKFKELKPSDQVSLTRQALLSCQGKISHLNAISSQSA